MRLDRPESNKATMLDLRAPSLSLPIALVISLAISAPSHGKTLGLHHPCKQATASNSSKTQPQIFEGRLSSGNALKFTLDGGDQMFGIGGLHLFKPAPEDLMLSKPNQVKPMVKIVASTSKTDRYGRILGQVFIISASATTHFQTDLIEKGLAVHAPIGLSPDCLKALRVAERSAQTAKRGVWQKGDLFSQANELEKLKSQTGHFSIVEGTVLSVGDRKRTLYLNFGKKWKRDFTVIVVKSGKAAYLGDLTALQNAKGATVRVRGRLEDRGGPLIRLRHPGQIEFRDAR